jgi:hypothetical protein
VGIGLDTNYGASSSGVGVYPSEKTFADFFTQMNAEKLASLLKDRFRFRVLSGPSQKEAARLDDLAAGIQVAVDAGRPVILRMSQAASDEGHVAIIQGYRKSTSGGLYLFDFLLNLGWGPDNPARWVPGGGAFDAGGFRWVGFQVIDVAPEIAPAPASALPASGSSRQVSISP